MNAIATTIKASKTIIDRIMILLFFASFILVTSIIEPNLLQIANSVIVLVAFSAWGHVIVFLLYYRKGDMIDGFIWGSIAGITIASLITSIIVYVHGWNIYLILLLTSLLPGIILLFQITSKNKNAIIVRGQSRIPTAILSCSFAIVTLFFYLPYKNLGAHVDDKYLYAWLFGHDFINRLVHIKSLSWGLPLEGMFFAGETLSYYWLAYIFPALLYNINVVKLEMHQLLQLTLLYYSLLTTAAFLLLLRKYVREEKYYILTLIVAFCSYSYVWILNVGIRIIVKLSVYPSIGTSETIANFSGFSHGLYRFFLVEPQSILAIGIMLMLFNLYNIGTNTYSFIIIGILLGLLFGVEATNGIMLMLWFCSSALFYFIIKRTDRLKIFQKHAIGFVCASLVYISLFSIEMYHLSTGKGALQLSANLFALKYGLLYLPVMYGPPLIFGFAGLYILIKKRESLGTHWIYPYVILLGISLFFVFFIQNPTEYHFGLLKATRTIIIVLLMLTVYFFNRQKKEQNISKFIIIVVALSLPTIISDNIIAFNVSKASTFLRSADMEAAKWARDNIPQDAIMQAYPNYPGLDKDGRITQYSYSFVPIFAQRKTAIGEWKVSSQEHARPHEVVKRFHSVIDIFSAGSLEDCLDIIKELKISHIYIGSLERKEYGEGVLKFENSGYFDRVYSSDEVKIYRVKLENL